MYFLWRHNGFKGSINKLSKAMEYKDDRNVRKVIETLIVEKRVRKVEKDGGEVFYLTRRGQNEIGYLTFPRTLLVALAIIAAAFAGRGLLDLWTNSHLSPVDEVVLGMLLLVFSIVMLCFNNQLEQVIMKYSPEDEGDKSSPPDEPQVDEARNSQ